MYLSYLTENKRKFRDATAGKVTALKLEGGRGSRSQGRVENKSRAAAKGQSKMLHGLEVPWICFFFTDPPRVVSSDAKRTAAGSGSWTSDSPRSSGSIIGSRDTRASNLCAFFPYVTHGLSPQEKSASTRHRVRDGQLQDAPKAADAKCLLPPFKKPR